MYILVVGRDIHSDIKYHWKLVVYCSLDAVLGTHTDRSWSWIAGCLDNRSLLDTGIDMSCYWTLVDRYILVVGRDIRTDRYWGWIAGSLHGQRITLGHWHRHVLLLNTCGYVHFGRAWVHSQRHKIPLKTCGLLQFERGVGHSHRQVLRLSRWLPGQWIIPHRRSHRQLCGLK